MKAYKRTLMTAFAAGSMAVAGTAAAAQEAEPAPRTEEKAEPTLTQKHKQMQAQARALLPALESRSFLCNELYDLTKMVIETPQITDHPMFTTAYAYSIELCKQRESGGEIGKQKLQETSFRR